MKTVSATNVVGMLLFVAFLSEHITAMDKGQGQEAAGGQVSNAEQATPSGRATVSSAVQIATPLTNVAVTPAYTGPNTFTPVNVTTASTNTSMTTAANATATKSMKNITTATTVNATTTKSMQNITTATTVNATTTKSVQNITTATTVNATTTTKSVQNITTATTVNATTATTHVSNSTTSNTTTLSPNVTTTFPSNQTTPSPGPTISPHPSHPEVGNYSVKENNNPCIMAHMGTQLILKPNDQNKSYFNVDPKAVNVSGNCGKEQSTMKLLFKGGFVSFIFTKSGNNFYINSIEALLTVSATEIYKGKVTGLQLNKASLGKSFTCKSSELEMGNVMKVVLEDIRMQAFHIKAGQFGKAEDCTEKNRHLAALIVGICVIVLIVLVVIGYLIYRRKKSSGYERI